MAAIKIKLGKADSGCHIGDSIIYDLLARRGSGDWESVGEVTADKSCTSWSVCQSYDQYKISDLSAYIYLDESFNVDTQVEVFTGAKGFPGTGRNKITEIRTVAEAKRMIKAWAAAQLESIDWNQS